jgi:oligosaccharyltransferase complex subunit delta (ribophorin II)
LSAKTPLSKPITLGATESIKVSFTAKDNGVAKRPHQAFVFLQDIDSGLEAPFPLEVKDSGKGSVLIVSISVERGG